MFVTKKKIHKKSVKEANQTVAFWVTAFSELDIKPPKYKLIISNQTRLPKPIGISFALHFAEMHLMIK